MTPPSRHDDNPDEAPGVGSSVDNTLRALEHPLRRDVIECCATSSEHVFDIDEVADFVGSLREEVGEPVDGDELLNQLHHQHLPMLADSGMIEFDPRGGQFRYDRDELLERWLRRIRAEESR